MPSSCCSMPELKDDFQLALEREESGFSLFLSCPGEGRCKSESGVFCQPAPSTSACSSAPATAQIKREVAPLGLSEPLSHGPGSYIDAGLKLQDTLTASVQSLCEKVERRRDQQECQFKSEGAGQAAKDELVKDRQFKKYALREFLRLTGFVHDWLNRRLVTILLRQQRKNLELTVTSHTG